VGKVKVASNKPCVQVAICVWKVRKREEKMGKSYKNLLVWHKAHELICQIYLETKQFPKDEVYGITSQLRRASVSIAANIVEGAGRQSKNELRQFIKIALGSLAETEYLLELCLHLKYLKEDKYNKMESIRSELGAMLWQFHKNL
jgi:four helix bundle protein